MKHLIRGFALNDALMKNVGHGFYFIELLSFKRNFCCR